VDCRCQIWDWSNYDVPINTWPVGAVFASDSFRIDSETDPHAVTNAGNKLRFYLDPIRPTPPPEADNRFNMRAEIQTEPWDVQHPLGTEQWLGWRYTFGDNYRIDPTAPIVIFQNHPRVPGHPPLFSLEIAAYHRPTPAVGGEIQVINDVEEDRIVYPVKPMAGDQLDVVIHVVFGLEDSGKLQVWLNGTLYYDFSGATVYEGYEWGGRNKWGIYHHLHRDSTAVANSLAAGVPDMELFMGPLKMIQRDSSDPEYLQDAYLRVRPDAE